MSGGTEAPPSSPLHRYFSNHHVLAVEPPLKVFSPPDTLNAFTKVFYDEIADEMVVIQGNNVQFSPLFASPRDTRGSSEWSLPDTGRVNLRGAKRSLGKRWLAVLKSDKDISFYEIVQSNVGTRPTRIADYTCKQSFQLGSALTGGAKRNTVVKDFFWLSTNTILILTSTTIEVFMVSGTQNVTSPPAGKDHKTSRPASPRGEDGGIPSQPSQTLQRVRQYATTIDFYTYFPRHKILLCISKDKPQLVKTYRVGGSGIVRFTKIKLDDATARPLPDDLCSPAYSFAGERLPNFQYTLARLYGNTCLLHITSRQELMVYTLNTSTTVWEKTATLGLFERATFSLNVVDNLIVAHNLNNKITQVYDHRISNAPIAAPIRIGFYRAEETTPEEDTQGTPSTPPENTVGPSNLSLTGENNSRLMRLYDRRQVVTVFPDKLLDLSGYLYGLAVDLQAIIPSFSPKPQLLAFLLQRRLSKGDVLSHVSALCSNPDTPLSQVSASFDLIIGAMSKGMKEQGGRGGYRQTPSAPQNHSLQSAGSQASQKEEEKPKRDVSMESAGMSVTTVFASTMDAEGLEAETASLPTSGPVSPAASPKAASLAGRESLSLSPRGDRIVACFEGEGGEGAVGASSGGGARWKPYPFYTTSGDWYTLGHLLVVEQIDMFKEVFCKMHEEKDSPISSKRFLVIFLEYARSLSEHQIKLKDMLQRFLIDTLIYSNPPMYPKLHHFLQYHIIQDSIPIALQLLKFEDKYVVFWLSCIPLGISLSAGCNTPGIR